MEINVAQLLKSPIGTTRSYKVDEEVEFEGETNPHPVKGDVKLIRTQRGVLAQAKIEIQAELTCSRCLEFYRTPLKLDIEEEYIPSIDVNTGVPVESPEDDSADSAFLIDEHHVIDLTEAIRQYKLLASPMKPLCKETCPGLCVHCGKNLNEGKCNCPDDTDPRWSALTEKKL